MLFEFHILKNYPPVNLNRDEAGAPKSCFFGGVQRGRISSQCLKHTWRNSSLFHSLDSLGTRTRKMPTEVGKLLQEMGVSDELINEAVHKLALIGTNEEKPKKGNKKADEQDDQVENEVENENKDAKENDADMTKQVIFYSANELEEIAHSVKDAIEEDKSLKVFKKRPAMKLLPDNLQGGYKILSADIALFGRMVTSGVFANVDAAMSVAHAISTHAVIRESDYFTTIDDLLKQGSGAAMVDDTDYNSCCYYEYASLDTEILRDNMKCCPNENEVLKQLVPTLIRVMALTNPSGKQHAFAGPVSPEVMIIECKKEKIPLSYVNAFEVPVPTWGSRPNIVENSVKRLAEHVNQMDNAYGLPVLHRAWFASRYKDICPENCEEYNSLPALMEVCAAWMNEEQAG